RDVGTRPDLIQQVEFVIPAEAQVEKHPARLAYNQQANSFLRTGSRDGTQVTIFEIIDDHAVHHWVVIDDQNPRRVTASHAHHGAQSPKLITAAPIHSDIHAKNSASMSSRLSSGNSAGLLNRRSSLNG